MRPDFVSDSPMYIPAVHSLSPLALTRAWCSRGVVRGEPRVYASQARHLIRVLAAALLGLGLTELLVPAYICREALAELDDCPLRLRFFDVRDDLSPALEELADTARDGAALLLLHYFGFPNAVAEVTRFCRKKRVLLIEDCAQALYSTWEGRPLGAWGAAAIFSPRKFLPLPHGAYAVLHHPGLQSLLATSLAPSPATLAPLARQLGHWALMKSRFPRPNHGQPELWPEGQPMADGATAPGISPLARRLLTWYQGRAQDIVARRRRNYQRLCQWLAPLPITPLYPELPPEICPLVLPVLTPRRDDILIKLRRQGIGAQFWPTLPAAILNHPGFPEANRLRRKVLLLPIHQDLTEGHMDSLGQAFTAIFAHEI